MMQKMLFVATAMLLALIAVACNYPGFGDEPSEPAPPTLPVLPTVATLAPLPVEPEGCDSALTPGRWAGSASINTVASSMGFRVVNQNVTIPLQLQIDCDGSVTGTAVREGTGQLRVPFALDGACTENASYEIEGVVLPSGNTGRPVLSLTFNTLEGRLSCNLDSRLSNIPSGEQNRDLTGSTFDIDLVPDFATPDRISGSEWQDTLYQDQFGEMEEMMDESNVETTTTSSWELVLQR
jgi:hypothetical protein